jgi:hypothetical protein
MLVKRIFAVVSDDDFYGFLNRSKAEGLSMAEAFAALTHMYATGKLKEDLHDFKNRYHEIKTAEDGHKPTLEEAEGEQGTRV